MEKLSGKNNLTSNRLTCLSKNMLSVIFGFVDLKTTLNLRKVVRKFKEVIESEIDFPIFKEFVRELHLIHTDQNFYEVENIFYNANSTSYITNLADRLREKYRSSCLYKLLVKYKIPSEFTFKKLFTVSVRISST